MALSSYSPDITPKLYFITERFIGKQHSRRDLWKAIDKDANHGTVETFKISE